VCVCVHVCVCVCNMIQTVCQEVDVVLHGILWCVYACVCVHVCVCVI